MANRDHGENPVVRVDLDASSDSGSDLPEVESPSGSPSRFALMLLVFASIGVPIILFLLNAGSDGGSSEEGPLRGPEPIDEPAVLSRSDTTLLELTRVDDPEPLTSIVRLDDGFIGLAGGEGTAPRILRSDDGDTWSEVETTATSLGAELVEDGSWFDLTLVNGRLQLRGQVFRNDVRATPQNIFVSNDGIAWEQVDGVGSLGQQRVSESVLALLPNGYFAAAFTFEELSNSFLEEHTTLAGLEENECTFDEETNRGEAAFVVRDCFGEDMPRELGPSVFESSSSDEELLNCLSVLSDGALNSVLVRGSFDSEGERVLLGQADILAPPTVLGDGGLSFVDTGNFGFRPDSDGCDGVTDLPGETEASVVIIDGATNEFRRWPLPETENGDEVARSAAVIGEYSSADGASQLAVGYEGGIWALDREAGTWEVLQAATEEVQFGRPFIFGGPMVHSSETSDLLYAVTRDGLAVVDPDVSDESGLITIPIELPELRFDIDRVLYADDESIFVQFESQVWRLNLS